METLRKIAKPSRDVLLNNARQLVPVLRERSNAINQARHVPAEILKLAEDAGLMQLTRPKRYGGRDESVDLVFRIAQILAEGDGSAAWVYAVTNSHDQSIGLFPEAIQDEYWASEQALCASSYQPAGKAVAVEGGYRLTGKWSFCSGIDHCGWIVVGSMLPAAEGARPDLGLFLARKRDLEVVDDWHVFGLTGTGSKSVVINNLFIPNAEVLNNRLVVNCDTPGRALHQNPIYGTSPWVMFGFAIMAPATGIVRGAYNTMVAEFQERAKANDPMFESKRLVTQMRLAEASAYLSSAELLFEDALQDTYEHIMQVRPLNDELRTRNRRNQAFMARFCRQAMDVLMSMAGGRGIREGGAVQRATRDLFAISAHPGGNWDSASASYGSVLLGGAPTEPFC